VHLPALLQSTLVHGARTRIAAQLYAAAVPNATLEARLNHARAAATTATTATEPGALLDEAQLAGLYFATDSLYAVYIPFAVPALAALVLSLAAARKRAGALRKLAKKTD
jgi:hypothetical protein